MPDTDQARATLLSNDDRIFEKDVARRLGTGEELLPLAEAAKCLPTINCKKICIATIWRWCRKGLRGKFLPYVRIGRRIFVTRQALLEFFTTLTELDRQVPPDTRSQPRILKRRAITSRERERALAEADAILEKAGI